MSLAVPVCTPRLGKGRRRPLELRPCAWQVDPAGRQHTGCQSHLYIPALLKRWGEPTDASAEEGWVSVRPPMGTSSVTAVGLTSYTSKELSGWTPALLRSPEFAEIRAKYEARFLSDDEWEAAA